MFGIKRKSTIREDRTFRNTQKENTASMQEFKSLFEHIEPFHNIQEFKDALMSENWATTENLGKFWVTFPNLDRRLYKRIFIIASIMLIKYHHLSVTPSKTDWLHYIIV